MRVAIAPNPSPLVQNQTNAPEPAPTLSVLFRRLSEWVKQSCGPEEKARQEANDRLLRSYYQKGPVEVDLSDLHLSDLPRNALKHMDHVTKLQLGTSFHDAYVPELPHGCKLTIGGRQVDRGSLLGVRVHHALLEKDYQHRQEVDVLKQVIDTQDKQLRRSREKTPRQTQGMFAKHPDLAKLKGKAAREHLKKGDYSQAEYMSEVSRQFAKGLKKRIRAVVASKPDTASGAPAQPPAGVAPAAAKIAPALPHSLPAQSLPRSPLDKPLPELPPATMHAPALTLLRPSPAHATTAAAAPLPFPGAPTLPEIPKTDFSDLLGLILNTDDAGHSPAVNGEGDKPLPALPRSKPEKKVRFNLPDVAHVPTPRTTSLAASRARSAADGNGVITGNVNFNHFARKLDESHATLKISGDDNNCWWRASWASIFAQYSNNLARLVAVVMGMRGLDTAFKSAFPGIAKNALADLNRFTSQDGTAFRWSPETETALRKVSSAVLAESIHEQRRQATRHSSDAALTAQANARFDKKLADANHAVNGYQQGDDEQVMQLMKGLGATTAMYSDSQQRLVVRAYPETQAQLSDPAADPDTRAAALHAMLADTPVIRHSGDHDSGHFDVALPRAPRA